MPKRCALEAAFRLAFKGVVSPRDQLRVIMRVNEILGGDMPGFDMVALQAAREKWAAELPEMLTG